MTFDRVIARLFAVAFMFLAVVSEGGRRLLIWPTGEPVFVLPAVRSEHYTEWFLRFLARTRSRSSVHLVASL